MQTTIPIQLLELDDKGIHLIIKARLDDDLLINLIIDTGASKTVFDINLLQDYCTFIDEENTIESKGINSEFLETKKAEIKKIKFGNIEFTAFETVLLDLSNINDIYSEFSDLTIYGLIGGDFLIKHKAVINYHDKTLSFSE